MSQSTPAADILKEARSRLQLCIDSEQDNRIEALDDLRFVSGDQWPGEMKAMRQQENRPCLTINKLPAYIHSVTNDQRQNRPSIKIHPVDDEADPETADVIQGMIRHIEYSSNADVAYDTAVSSAATIGFGYFRLVTEYCYDNSFDQDIKFKRIRNPFTVYLDPAHQEPDGSDMTFGFITEWLSTEEFDAQYPDATVTSDGGAILNGPNDDEPIWMDTGRVRLAEYMRIEETPEKLYRMPDGTAVWESELPPELKTDPLSLALLKSRTSAKREVWWYKITGADVLERKKIDCYWIPIFPVYGDEADIEGKVMRSGIVRFAKDPQRQYNFMMTCATEEVALRPKTPYIGAEGQFEGYEDEWAQANNRSYAYLQYVPVSLDGTQSPPPQRQPMADVPSGMLMMSQHASDNIKSATGIFDASLGAKGNETSGVAITSRQREGDVANFHYADNLIRTLRHAARCIMWMIPYVYDVERVVKIMGEDGKMNHAVINQQSIQYVNQEGQMVAITKVLNDLSAPDYDVTVAAGPSYSTLRQETLSQLLELSQTTPKLMDIAGDKVIGAMDMHGGEEIAERWKRTIPPQILGPQDTDDDPQAQIEQLTGQLNQAQQQMQQMNQVIQAAHQEIQQLDAKQQVTIQKAQIDQSAETEREQMRLAGQTQHIALREENTNARHILSHQTSTGHVALKEDNANQRAVVDHIGSSQSDDIKLQIAQLQRDSNERIALAADQSKEQIAALTGMVQLLIAKMQPPPVVAEEAADKV